MESLWTGQSVKRTPPSSVRPLGADAALGLCRGEDRRGDLVGDQVRERHDALQALAVDEGQRRDAEVAHQRHRVAHRRLERDGRREVARRHHRVHARRLGRHRRPQQFHGRAAAGRQQLRRGRFRRPRRAPQEAHEVPLRQEALPPADNHGAAVRVGHDAGRLGDRRRGRDGDGEQVAPQVLEPASSDEVLADRGAAESASAQERMVVAQAERRACMFCGGGAVTSFGVVCALIATVAFMA
eukprot:CAMPEP_0119261136 /NCGR_PEP_ID=MMETSP1329-20130426/1275_1 /TAXON_ID=114041 /ORGANISM="Genus nov. species nov., Strain RCC1024" /LENGTH=240 /DNA_ID=CAMNT_0007260637 /DNA_START=17 /DNA_END=740 /DNA_ORIENTATION=-